MRFECKEHGNLDIAIAALEFLKKAHEEGKLNEIENFDDVLDAIDLISEVEYLQQRLKDYNISYWW